jgi:hypothetical protein
MSEHTVSTSYPPTKNRLSPKEPANVWMTLGPHPASGGGLAMNIGACTRRAWVAEGHEDVCARTLVIAPSVTRVLVLVRVPVLVLVRVLTFALVLMLTLTSVGCRRAHDGDGEHEREGAGAGTNSPAATAPPLTIALITIDTLRADHVGCYGDTAAHTPTIDALARDGAMFEQARTVAPITLTAHASLMTGRYPPRHGVRDNGLFRLPDGARTLAEMLGERGFATAAFVSAFVLDRMFGMAQGFAIYDDDCQAQFGGTLGVDERGARATTDAALRALAGASPQAPLFLWVHYYDPHAPYNPPAPYDRSSQTRRTTARSRRSITSWRV